MACLFCLATGTLNNHGRLKNKAGKVSGIRWWCCPRRKGHPGCGRSFCVWLAEVVPRHSVSAGALTRFLAAWSTLAGDVLATREAAKTGLSPDSAYRWVKRFLRNQGEVRLRHNRVRAPPRPYDVK